jgi:eukaryotic-like serine/threonine-protein kinase
MMPIPCFPEKKKEGPALFSYFKSYRMLLGRYEVLDVAGNGNFSSVHKGKDTKTGDTVAVKIMRSHQSIGLREGLLLKGMEHPNIVKLYDFEQEGGETRMVLEYMPENTLELY